MGIYLNPGKRDFEEAVRSEVFVDKTDMINQLNQIVSTKQKYVCVSRPRRFGKTIAVDMLCAYYGRNANSRELFEKMKVAKSSVSTDKKRLSWDEYLGKYDVIRIVMTDFFGIGKSVQEMIDDLTDEVGAELMEAYPTIPCKKKNNLRLIMNGIYGSAERQCIILIDEWDVIFRTRKDDKDGQVIYMNFLRDWLKDKSYIALSYMTGILPIKKYGENSALNMFSEYSMVSSRKLSPYVGFTKEEVIDICRERNLNYNALKEWYDGYILSTKTSHKLSNTEKKDEGVKTYEIYCPLSVVSAVMSGDLENYWNNSESFEALAEYIRKDFDKLKETVALLMNGAKIKIDTSSYQNDMTSFAGQDDVLTMLIHLGYLGYDSVKEEVFIPNKEIMDVFKTSTKSREWVDTFRAFDISLKLLRATWDKDENKVAEIVEEAHNRTANKTYNDEAALSYGIQYAYYAAQKYYTTILELDTGKGFADIVYLPSPRYPDKPAMLIELKYNKNADTAINQIKQHNYPDRLEHYKGNLLLVGINYEKNNVNQKSDFKHHTCVIEQA